MSRPTSMERREALKTATEAVQEAVRRAVEEPGFVMTRQKLTHLLADVVKLAKQDGWHQAFDAGLDTIDIVEHRHSVILDDRSGARVATECLTAVAALRAKEPT